MQLKTILNLVEKHPGFVYGRVTLVRTSGKPQVHVHVAARKGSRAVCSGCGKRRPGYDKLDTRSYQFIPLWALSVSFLYTPRRVDCPRCGVVVEMVPWATGKQAATTSFLWFLSSWAKSLSWKETARRFGTSPSMVFAAVEMAVAWGRANMSLENIRSIGVDEIAWRVGQRYFTVVYQIDHHQKRLLWIAEKRTAAAFSTFFDWLGDERSRAIDFVASDMWKAFLKVVKQRAPGAQNVLDRFHVMQMVARGVDEVRRAEVRKLKAAGKTPVLADSRYLLLKNHEKLDEGQASRLGELMRINLRSVKAYLLKEELRRFWSYSTPHWAGRFLDQWTATVLRTRIEPLHAVARSFRKHRSLILNWFDARRKGAFALGATEGLNNKAKLSSKIGYGFRTERHAKVALFHRLGGLPEPAWLTHRFTN